MCSKGPSNRSSAAISDVSEIVLNFGIASFGLAINVGSDSSTLDSVDVESRFVLASC